VRAAAIGAGLAFASIVAATPLAAHPGGLAADGCHSDRKNGGRHCHGATSAPAPAARDSRLPGSRSTAFANCAEARAAGAAPVRRGDPGYSARLDRDGDGIGCE
jgi:hypothetical protein